MKSYQVTIFMFGVIACLVILAFLFPKEGVQIGSVHLRFYKSEEKLMVNDYAGDVLPHTDRAELTEEDEEEIVNDSAELIINDELSVINDDSNHVECEVLSSVEVLETCDLMVGSEISFPNDSVGMLDDFFVALKRAREVPMRVVHYGDSQIEEDRITSELRDGLQERFGGCGVGYIPVVQHIPTVSVKQRSTVDLERKLVYAHEAMRADHSRYGMAGAYAELNGEDVQVTIECLAKRGMHNYSQRFEKMTLMLGQVREPISISVDGVGMETVDSTRKSLNFVEFDMRRDSLPAPMRATLNLSGVAELQGILLDGMRGVSVDNVPMRGCTGLVFTKMSAEVLSGYYADKNVRLIIMQYGGNAVPYLKNKAGVNSVARGLQTQIRYLKRLAPQAEVLFIGPSDMATRGDGVMQSYAILPELIAALKKTAHAEGAAYWDLQAVMGGAGSMVKWAAAKPALASSDHVHFTRLGASKVGEMLLEELLRYYK